MAQSGPEVAVVKPFQSKIKLGDSVLRLVSHGVIEPQKLEAIYEDSGGLPDEMRAVLNGPSHKLILLTRANANYYVNLLWPLGLANSMSSNERSPINKLTPVKGASLFDFASTAGWTLGKEANGGKYFNKFKIVELTPEQEALVMTIATNAYRPCCDNSTFFQDCNHGSALLGLLQLGAAQGLTHDELWREALAFNSFWFPHHYAQSALYFKAVRNIDWQNVDAEAALGADYSSASGWSENVEKELKRLGLAPTQQDGSRCAA